MRRYEGLFILNKSDDAAKDVIDKITADIQTNGGKIETIQKMEKKSFVRVADKKYSSGYYVNIIFEGNPEAIAPMRSKFGLNEDIFRVMFTQAPTPKEPPKDQLKPA